MKKTNFDGIKSFNGQYSDYNKLQDRRILWKKIWAVLQYVVIIGAVICITDTALGNPIIHFFTK